MEMVETDLFGEETNYQISDFYLFWLTPKHGIPLSIVDVELCPLRRVEADHSELKMT